MIVVVAEFVIADWDRREGRWLRVCEVELVRKSWCFIGCFGGDEWVVGLSCRLGD
jgi:hypothetical protein